MSGTNNIILAQPEAGNSVNYTLNAGSEAKLSFTAEDISQVRMEGDGSLLITFANGGEMSIENFESLANAGTHLTLSDGSELDPALINNGFTQLADAGNDNHFMIDVPAEGVIREITLEPGQDYYFNFALQSPIDASAQTDGSYIFSFANNAKLVLSNYAEAMKWENKPELITDTEVCALSNEELITTIEQLVMAPQGEEEIVEEEVAEGKPVDAEDVANMEPAAGEEGVEEEIAQEVIDELAALADALAEVEPAAGDDAGGSSNSGYGYNSQATPAALGSIDAIGPLGRTVLGYNAPSYGPEIMMDVDDIPVFSEIPDEALDESDFNGGPLVATGTVTVNYGADTPGAILPNGVVNAVGSVANDELTSGGVQVEISLDGNGYIGEANGELVFTFSIDPYTGQYTYTQYKTFDHADADNPDDVITIQLGIAAVDSDGSTAASMVVIRLADDAPIAHEVFGNVDETDIGPAIATGSMDFNYGADANGSLSTNGSFSAGGSLTGGALTHNGVAVVVTQTATGYIGMAGGVAVFTLHVNLNTGDYTYTQLAAIDHADTDDANDVITLSFGMDITDYDGDTVAADITISVADDGPVASSVSGSVDETDLSTAIATGSMNYDYGSDAAGNLSANGSFAAGGSLTAGELTSNGGAVVVSQTANGYVGMSGGVTIFTLEVDLSNGTYVFTQLAPLDHADTANANDVITLTFGMDVTDADGDTVATDIIINVADDGPIAVGEDLATIEDQTLTGNVMSNDDLSNDGVNVVSQVEFNGGFFAVPNNGSVTIVGNYGVLIISSNGNYSYTADHWNPDGTDTFTYTIRDFDGDTSTAEMSILVSPIDDIPVLVDPVKHVVDETDLGVIEINGLIEADFFTDGPGTFHTDGNFTVSGSMEGGTLSHDGQPITVTHVGREYIGTTAGGVTVFTLHMNENGEYTFKLLQNLDHADANDANDVITLNFGIRANDFDDDTDSGFITVDVKDDVATAATVHNTTDETNLDAGPITVGGTLTHDFGADGVGSIQPGGSAVATANGGPLALTSGGVAVIITQTANGYVGTAGGATVFTLTMNASTGAYSFTQNGPLDHPNGTDANDALSLNFTFDVADGDGDTVQADVVITVRDDGPVAVNDGNLLVDTAQTVSGNLLTNDDAGSDGVGQVTQVSFGGTSAGIPQGGSVTLTSIYGTLTVNADGTYTYKIVDPATPATSEVFTYVMRDVDGDTSTANLSINIENRDEVPVLVDPIIRTVDETDLGTAATHLTGQLEGEFNDDGFGSFAGNGTFGSNGSQLGGALTSAGVPVSVVFNAGTGTYTGSAGSKTIFTLKVNPNGSYVFDLTGTLDHADPNDPNDIINLNFGIIGRDADGDSDTTTLTIRVKDDVPKLDNSAGNVDETNLAHGQVSYSDSMDITMGGDIGSISPTGGFTTSVAALTSGGAAVVVTQTATGYIGKVGTATIFTLSVNPQTGKYTYTQFEPLDHPNTTNHNDTFNLNFGMQVTTVDGDSDTATITITVADDGVDARNDINGAEEDQTITGNVLHNDYLSKDEANTVSKITFGGTTYNVPAGGSVVINTIFGKMTMNSNGSYTYQALAEDPNGTESFTYTLRDGDGDTDTAALSIRVTPDGEPVAVTKTFDVDETNLTPGPMIFNGNMNVDFGRDGMGTTGGVAGNGSFSASASLAGGALKSNGVAVAVTQTSTGYVGMAGSKQVFTLTINKDGTYSFRLLDTLDHANATDPNDVIRLDFGVTITDSDGDTAAGSIKINVHDDAPVAYDENRSYEENAPAITGNVTSNDNGSEDLINTVTRVVVNGTGYNVPASGNVVITGTYGQLTINSTGAYSYRTTVNNPNGVDRFTYTLRDGDGDTDTAVLSITVTPDAVPTVAYAADLVDETSLNSGTLVENGTISVNYHGDAAGGVTGTGGFSASGSMTGGSLRHMGTGIGVTYNASTDTYTGSAGSKTIFTLKINANGTYTYRQFDQIDHANGGDANDVINLNFGIRATDADGDSGTNTLTIQVRDDGPVARNDTGSTAFVGAASTGNMLNNDTVGADNGGNVRVLQVSYAGQTVNVAASGWTTITEQVVETRWFLFWSWQETVTISQLQVNANGDYRLTNNREGNRSFTYIMQDNDGDRDSATVTARSVNPPPPPPSGDGGGSPLVLDLDGDGIELTSTQDGVNFDVGVDGVMDQVAWVASDDALLGIDLNNDGIINDHNELFGRLDQDGFNVLAEHNSNGDAQIDANDDAWDQLLAWRDLNQDGIATEDEMFTMEELGIASISLAVQATDYYVNGSWVPYSSTFTFEDGTTNQIADAWFKFLSLESWMQVVNTLGYEAAVAWLDSAYDGAVTTDPMEMAAFNADGPIVMGLVEKIYEDDLGTEGSQISDEVTIFYGDEQPGEMSGNGKFQSSGSMDGGALTVGGVAVVVSFDPATGIYTGMAGDEIAFALRVGGDGTYDFKQFMDLDHQTGNNFDNFITLEFGIEVTNANGDMNESSIRLQVINSGDAFEGLDLPEQGVDLYGVEGTADTFFFQAIKESADTLHDFNRLEGDALDLSALLEGQDGVTEAINDFVHSREEAGSTIISVDVDGAGAGAAVDIARIDGMTGLDVQEMLNDGNLIV